MTSPCIRACNLQFGMCDGCERTLKEISEWSKLDMGDRMEIMKQLSGHTSTHNCPDCEGPAYCAMEAGKSSSACWCMSLDAAAIKGDASDFPDDVSCLCRKCLKKVLGQ